MNIQYRTKKLEKILSNDRQIKKHYTSFYEGVMNRLYELKSVSNLSLISHNPPPRKHKLSGNFDGFWSVDVSKNYRLLFTPVSDTTDESNITEIMIEGIEDIH